MPKNNIRLSEIEDVMELKIHLDKDPNKKKVNINFGNYMFEYYDYSPKYIEKIRFENIFKCIFFSLKKQFEKYFNNIKFKIAFEELDKIDTEYICTIDSEALKYDVYLTFSPKYIHNTNYTFGIEYNEKDSHTRSKCYQDEAKENKSKVILDEYFQYNEYNKNLDKFIKETLYSLLKYCFVCNDDYLELAKINMIYKRNITDKKMLEKLDDVIQLRKVDSFDFADLYQMIKPFVKNTGKIISIEDFWDMISSHLDENEYFVSDDAWFIKIEYLPYIIHTLQSVYKIYDNIFLTSDLHEAYNKLKEKTKCDIDNLIELLAPKKIYIGDVIFYKINDLLKYYRNNKYSDVQEDDMTHEEFITYLRSNGMDIEVYEYNYDDYTKYFVKIEEIPKIFNYVDTLISEEVNTYKKVNSIITDLYFDAVKEILQLQQNKNEMKKKYIPKFLTNYETIIKRDLQYKKS